MFTHQRSVHHSLSTLNMGIEDAWKFSKQISKLFFQMRVHIYYPLGQTEGVWKVFVGVEWRREK